MITLVNEKLICGEEHGDEGLVKLRGLGKQLVYGRIVVIPSQALAAGLDPFLFKSSLSLSEPVDVSLLRNGAFMPPRF
jgi:hypothetical protein